MSSAPLDPAAAGGIVDAQLGRPAQDVLEAAVVLEAWGGVPTVSALRLGSDVLPHHEQTAAPGRRRTPPRSDERESILAEGVALLMAIIAIAAWAGPLSDQLGSAALEQALTVALPLTLGLQWALRSRYLSRRAGVHTLAEEAAWLCLIAGAIELPLLLLPRFGPIAGMLVAIWVGGTVLARRGWGIAYGGLLIAEAVGLAAGLAAGPSLAVVAMTTLIAVGIAVHTAPTPVVDEPPGPLGRAFSAGVTGGLLGGLLVGDVSLGWGIHGAFPALALVPSVIGSFWGGYYLWEFHDEVPRGLRGVPLAQASGRISHGPAVEIVVGALLRLIGITALLSALVLAAGPWTQGSNSLSLFVAFGFAALACLFVSLLESLGYLRWALASAAAGLLVELAWTHWAGTPVPGGGLIVGGATTTVLSLAPLMGLLRSPGRVLATALWIR